MNYLWLNIKYEKLLMKVKHSQNRLYKLIVDGSRSVCLMKKIDEDSWLWLCKLGQVNLSHDS